MSKVSILITLLLSLALAGLGYRLLWGQGGYAAVAALQQQIDEQRAENARLAERNRLMAAEVAELKQGMETVEERARHELGMVREGETLYLLVE